MENRSGVSIIIPSYNPGSYILETVESIISQPFKRPYEIIVVDDGSTDKETHRCLDWLATQPNLIVSKQKNNCGAQRARNVGLTIAEYDHILMMDADDRLNTDEEIIHGGAFTDRSIDLLQSRPDVAFVHAITYMFGDFSGPTISTYPLTEDLIIKKHHVPICIVYRKEDAINAGGYDESIAKWQDWSFAIGLLNARKMKGLFNNIEFINKPFYLYRIHQRTQRVSQRPINETEMIEKTILRNPSIFTDHFPSLGIQEIVNKVYSNKPSKLLDLLRVAAYDLTAAEEMVKRRNCSLSEGHNLAKFIP